MSFSPPPPPQPRGVDFSLPTCGEAQCNSRGTCVIPSGGGAELVCDCVLGYRGMYCEDTVNEAVSLPLTLGVLSVILGAVILAFIVAKIRQRYNRQHRKAVAAAGQGNNMGV